ncbi:PfkB family carbohydrate kinase [Ornithinibacillus halophilus]|uniref:Sugar or nucleoside kinase, ribokinase family n=1 Tax=Ornithinibacillus halophilus TaxID=930117 RepID=A0A1M5GCH0_9BACI|nr:PfkB family carbohydrate kinase [Ornithinibacillus halophilus]SHG01447.1 Sugar or nucleoside kinase, ribokinase family [Ornithinibacillus halophilus]
MELNEREKRVLELIQRDPFISQQALADELELSRPSVANIISGLVKKGYIRGKAYILNEPEQIICVGGANLDRKFYLKEAMQLGTSNPVNSTQSAGGVARNIAENLGRMGENVSLLTVCGRDAEWDFIEQASIPYVNMDHVEKLSESSTGSYTAVLDEEGNMKIALADMDIYDQLSPEIIQENVPILKQSKCILADLNCPSETLSYLSQVATGNKIPLVVIAVSAPKMKRLPENLGALTWLITNQDETEGYFNITITNKQDWKAAAEKWLDLGVKNIVITSGDKGVMIGNSEEGVVHIPAVKVDEVVDVTGAGDAFSAAAVHAWLSSNSIEQIAKAGVVNAAKTLQSSFTVRQNLTSQQLKHDMEEF